MGWQFAVMSGLPACSPKASSESRRGLEGPRWIPECRLVHHFQLGSCEVPSCLEAIGVHVASQAPIGMPRKAEFPEATKIAFTIVKGLLLTTDSPPLHACYLIT